MDSLALSLSVFLALAGTLLALNRWHRRRQMETDAVAYLEQLGSAFHTATWPKCEPEKVQLVMNKIQQAPPRLTQLQMRLRPELDQVEAVMGRQGWSAGVLEPRPDEHDLAGALKALQRKWETVRRERSCAAASGGRF